MCSCDVLGAVNFADLPPGTGKSRELFLQAFLDGRFHRLEHFGFGGCLCHTHRAFDRKRVRAAVTDEDKSVHAEQGRRAEFQIEMLSAQLDCSREHLSRQFRIATGVSPSDYLIQHRLRLAAREIRANGDKLELVARRTGFSSANYLCRAFRQRFGITPAQFRARPQMAIV